LFRGSKGITPIIERKSLTDDHRRLIAAARSAFPEGSSFSILGEGQLSSAVLVDEDLVVRFPLHRFGIERLQFEVELLRRVRPHLSVAVPEVTDVELDRSTSPYVAHRLLPGVALDAEVLRSLSSVQRDAASEQVARFLLEFHGLTDLSRKIPTPELPLEKFASQLKEEVDRLLATRMSPEAKARAYRELEGLANLNCHEVVLCHTDIGGNIVFDELTETVGIIDFGSTFISDHVLDVASLSVLGDDFLRAVTSRYPSLRARVEPSRIVRETFVLQDALYGARQDDWEYVDDVLSSY
jgi:aminoglycoside phosphotransferase (APT) family kinase protein